MIINKIKYNTQYFVQGLNLFYQYMFYINFNYLNKLLTKNQGRIRLQNFPLHSETLENKKFLV